MIHALATNSPLKERPGKKVQRSTLTSTMCQKANTNIKFGHCNMGLALQSCAWHHVVTVLVQACIPGLLLGTEAPGMMPNA